MKNISCTGWTKDKRLGKVKLFWGGALYEKANVVKCLGSPTSSPLMPHSPWDDDINILF